jgi:hypothetical protein
VRIETWKHAEDVTKIVVFVGGDRNIASDLLSAIEAKLK